MPKDDRRGGPGEGLVALLCYVERTMDRVEQTLPSVDHLAMRREPSDPESVASVLGKHGPSSLVESLQAWRQLLAEFEAAVARLTELRNGAARQAGYEKTLTGRISEVRRCRQALEEAAGEIRRRVIGTIDSGAGHKAEETR
jgi:hypothetical protein